MLSRNNRKGQVRQQGPNKQWFTIKKLTTGVVSVLIGFALMGMSTSADTQTISTTGTQTGIASATDTTTSIAPSATAPSYGGTKVVNTSFYDDAHVR